MVSWNVLAQDYAGHLSRPGGARRESQQRWRTDQIMGSGCDLAQRWTGHASTCDSIFRLSDIYGQRHRERQMACDLVCDHLVCSVLKIDI